EDRLVYLSYAEEGDGAAGTAVGRGKLSAGATALEGFEVIFRQQPKLSSGTHFGSRLVFDGDGHLFIALGDNNNRPTAQDLRSEDGRVYLSYAEEGDGAAGTAVGRGKLSADATALEGFEVIFRQQPKLSSGTHFGSRLVFDGDGHLFIALGDNNNRPTAQDLDKLQGKLVRIDPDGRIPEDNPFIGRAGARDEIWSYGHRNQQGAALNPWSGRLWTHEHGPRGGDDINIPEAGKNYGWPL